MSPDGMSVTVGPVKAESHPDSVNAGGADGSFRGCRALRGAAWPGPGTGARSGRYQRLPARKVPLAASQARHRFPRKAAFCVGTYQRKPHPRSRFGQRVFLLAEESPGRQSPIYTPSLSPNLLKSGSQGIPLALPRPRLAAGVGAHLDVNTTSTHPEESPSRQASTRPASSRTTARSTAGATATTPAAPCASSRRPTPWAASRRRAAS